MKLTLVNADFPSEQPVPPLGLVSLAHAAESVGCDATIRDYQLAPVEGSRKPQTFAKFCKNRDPILGVSTSGMALPLVLLGLRELKENYPDLITVLGGIGASGAAEQVVTEFPWVDFIVCGEGEETLKELLVCLDSGADPSSVPGLVCRRGEQVITTPRRPRLKDLGALGACSFKHLELSNYRLINVITARGCPFPCTFCDVAPYWERRFVARPIELVLAEIEAVVREINPAPTFVFVDDTLTIDLDRVRELCARLRSLEYPVEWACYARADAIDEPLLELMATSGCQKIYFGLESGSDSVLKRTRKGFDVETGLRAALLARQYLPHVQAAFVWGFPFETWEDFYETLMLMAYLVDKGINVKANILTPLPFSSIYREFAETLVFLPDYSPELHLAAYDPEGEIADLIRRHPRIFPCFYLFHSETLTAKYDMLREMGLSPEHIWDLWESVKGPVPSRLPQKEGSAAGLGTA